RTWYWRSLGGRSWTGTLLGATGTARYGRRPGRPGSPCPRWRRFAPVVRRPAHTPRTSWRLSMRPRTWWASTLIWAILCRRRLAVRVGSTLTSYGPSESTGMHLASRWAYLSEWTRRRGH